MAPGLDINNLANDAPGAPVDVGISLGWIGAIYLSTAGTLVVTTYEGTGCNNDVLRPMYDRWFLLG